jgi:hypothetical protein
VNQSYEKDQISSSVHVASKKIINCVKLVHGHRLKKKKSVKKASLNDWRHQINQRQFAPASDQTCSDNSEENISITSSSISSTAALTAACYARGLVIAHSRKLSANAWGLDINSLLSTEAHTQDLRFCRHQQHGDSNNARGLDDNFASDHNCDSTATTRLRHRRLCHADYAAPIKAKFSASKKSIII